MAYDSKIISDGDLSALDLRLGLYSKDGWIVRAGWFGNNRHYLALQRTPKEESSGPKNIKGGSTGRKTPAAGGAGE